MYRNRLMVIIICIPLFLWSCSQNDPGEKLPQPKKIVSKKPATPELKIQMIQTYPHDPKSFTQGLLFYKSRMFESTGLYGESTLREIDFETGEVKRLKLLPLNQFGEGLTAVGNKFYHLTWKAGISHVFDIETFKKLEKFKYQGEGWGICFDGTQLIMSNGSSNLFFRSPETFVIEKQIQVLWGSNPVEQINELEFVSGFIYANIWKTNDIIKINPKTGFVEAHINAEDLLTRKQKIRSDVLNGIAYHPERKTFFITGKLWPVIFEVKFIEPEKSGIIDESPYSAKLPTTE